MSNMKYFNTIIQYTKVLKSVCVCAQLREVAYVYHSCSQVPDVQVKNSVFVRWVDLLQQVDTARSCSNMSLTVAPPVDRHLYVRRCCSSLVISAQRRYGNTTSCDVCLNYDLSRLTSHWTCDTESLLQLSASALGKMESRFIVAKFFATAIVIHYLYTFV